MGPPFMKADNMTNDTPETNETETVNPWGKVLREFAPLFIFFVTYKFSDIYIATGAFMVAMIIAMTVAWRVDKHIPLMLKVTFVIVMISGSLTLGLSDPRFLYMKPTIINGIFAFLLAFGLWRGKSYLQLVMEAGIPDLAEKGWMIMTRNWMYFFIAMALVNEAVWRNFNEDIWVNFKMFGFLPLTIIFAMAQAPVIMKYSKQEDE